jgi:hypothetical protein
MAGFVSSITYTPVTTYHAKRSIFTELRLASFPGYVE